MDREALYKIIQQKRSFLCIGLDTDIQKIPPFLLKEKDPVYEFNRRIIDATHTYCVAYKPNIAFYESMGPRGWESLQKTLEYIPQEIFTIADAKRGDIGNTALMYARTFFDPASSGLDFDAVTVAPYMGEDSITPFLGFKNKWAIILAVTSNAGSRDFQFILSDGESLFLKVIKLCTQWGTPDNTMFVAGATRAAMFSEIRKIAPDHFLLVPGLGAQGGNLEEVSRFGMNHRCGLLVNSSRDIIYASTENDFTVKAAAAAAGVQQQMEQHLEKFIK